MEFLDRPATPADVDLICAQLPDTALGTSWGDLRTWKVGRPGHDPQEGKGFLVHRAPHHTAVDPDTGEMWDDLLVIHTPGMDAKAALVEGDNPFFTIDHFRSHPAVLVRQSRLGEISHRELAEILIDSWATKAPRRTVTAWFDTQPTVDTDQTDTPPSESNEQET